MPKSAVAPVAPLSATWATVRASTNLEERLRTAVNAWDDASRAVMGSITYQAPKVLTTVMPGTAAVAVGGVMNTVAITGSAARLTATRQVNEQTSTVRASTSALGIDAASTESASTLRGLFEINTATSTVRTSAWLGLDSASTERASTVRSSAEINTATTSVRSSTGTLGLDVTTAERASRLASTAEMNTATSSYDKIQLTFGSGTSTANLSGVYSGSESQLKIRVQDNAVLTSGVASAFKFQVRDENNAIVFSYDGNLKAGQAVDISGTGLSVQFSAGTTIKNQTSTTTNVSTTTPTNVDANGVFNAADVNARPRFEGGQQVTAGSFQVNGTTVNVLANDTINSVLTRIGGLVPGITASLANDRVTLSSATNSEAAITVGSDTSGFLAAVKLAGATTTTGIVRDDRETFATSTKLSAVSTGAFTVNGTSISVNRSTDTLESVIARVNASGAGATATYDANTDKLVFTPTVAGSRLVLGDDSSGFLAATKVETGARGTTANVNDRFDGSGMSDPLFDAGQRVTAGAFSINGTNIDVASSDSIASVLAKITASDAGVTASLDGDRVVLTSNDSSEQDITFGADTSGFLAAVKLADAATVRGNVRDQNESFAVSSKFGVVTDGSFTVNGTTVSVDRSTDSLASVIAKINEAGAGVTASYDTASDKLVLTPDTAGASLVLEDDTSGFFAAAGMELGARGTAANMAARFDGTSLGAPLLDGGHAITAGAFTINGRSIAVSADDSITSVIDKINASGAGVTAAVDEDRLTLTTNGASESAIALGADTSGFLAAMKLSGATTTVGNLRDTSKALAEMPGFGDLAAGSFRVNGVSIGVDPGTDKLSDVLERINASGAGVTATHDASIDRVVFTPTTAGSTLVLDEDTSGFFAAARVEIGARGTAANADAAFDGANASDPLLDPGERVTAGSFTINGARIDVGEKDSIRSVLAKITASDAGVTATYDADSERVELTAKTVGDTALTLGDDSSGFLRAVKLDSASLTRGESSGIGLVDAKLSAAFSSIASGSFSVNGATLTIDRETDTVRSVLDRINGLAGVSASLDTEQRANIRSTAPGALEIVDTTGFFAAIGLPTGRIHGEAERVTTSLVGGGDRVTDPEAAARRVANALTRTNEALHGVPSESAGDLAGARDAVRHAIEQLNRGAHLVDSKGPVVHVAEGQLANALRDDAHALDGLFSLRAALDAAATSLSTKRTTAEATARADAERAKPPPPTKAMLESALLGDTHRVLLNALDKMTVAEPAPKKKVDDKSKLEDDANAKKGINGEDDDMPLSVDGRNGPPASRRAALAYGIDADRKAVPRWPEPLLPPSTKV